MDLIIDKNKVGIGITNPSHQIHVGCKCGNEFFVDSDFKIHIIGMLQFKCNKCGEVINTLEPW